MVQSRIDDERYAPFIQGLPKGLRFSATELEVEDRKRWVCLLSLPQGVFSRRGRNRISPQGHQCSGEDFSGDIVVVSDKNLLTAQGKL